MSYIVWESYFLFSHKGNALLNILMDLGHVADWLRVKFVILGIHFIVLRLGLQGTVGYSLKLLVYLALNDFQGSCCVGDIFH